MSGEDAGPPELAIVVVTYNSSRDIVACLTSAVEQLPDDGSSVVVLDNHSSDDTAALVESAFPAVRLVRSDTNVGFARACNVAAAAAPSRFVLLLNPDAVLESGCVDALLDLARRRPRGGLYGGRALDADGRFDPKSCWGRPTLWSLFCFATGLSSVLASSEVFNPEGMGDWQRDRERPVDIVSGCLLLARRDVWDRLGGFDERFFMYGEDADLSLRAADLGYEPVITPDAQVRHIVGGSSLELDKHLMLYRGKASLVRKRWSGAEERLAVAFLLIGVGVRSRLAAVADRVLARRGSTGRTAAGVWSELWRRRREWRHGWPRGAV